MIINIYVHMYVRGGGVSHLLLRRGRCDAVAEVVAVCCRSPGWW